MNETATSTTPPTRSSATALPGSLGLYAVTIFLSAFLLFQVQPMIAKLILPWFGGSAAVWVTCMLFFQLALLLGYGYAHLMVRAVPLRHQSTVHMVLLLASLATLPILICCCRRPVRYCNPGTHALVKADFRIDFLPYRTWAQCWHCLVIQSWWNLISVTRRRCGRGREHLWCLPVAASQ